MQTHISELESNTRGIEFITGTVTKMIPENGTFIVQCIDGSNRTITVAMTKEMIHMVDNVRTGVYLTIHQTRSGPKTIITHSDREDTIDKK